eukprot:COSAG05_NODE_1776_length_4111_cov_87.186174_2_plen_817_part_00
MEPQPETATVLVCGTAIPVTAEELELAGVQVKGPEAFSALSQLVNLRTITLSKMTFSDAGWESLVAGIKGSPHLTHFNLTACGLGPKHAADLAGIFSSGGCNITTLCLAKNDALTGKRSRDNDNRGPWIYGEKTEGWVALCSALPSTMISLDFSGCALKPKSLTPLTDAIAKMPALNSLRCGSNPITDKGMIPLLDAVKGIGLTELDISKTKVGPPTAAKLAEVLAVSSANAAVKKINLSGCPLTGAVFEYGEWKNIDSDMTGFIALCGVLGKLHDINLSGCHLGPASAAEFAKAVSDAEAAVKMINLSGCPLTGAIFDEDYGVWQDIDSDMTGFIALCGVLGKLHDINLSGCHLGPASAAEFAKAVSSADAAVNSLTLDSNGIFGELYSDGTVREADKFVVEVQPLLDALKTSSITSLSLRSTGMGVKGVVAVADVIRAMAALAHLDCSQNDAITGKRSRDNDGAAPWIYGEQLDGWIAMCSSLSNSSITSLNFSACELNPKSLTPLADAIKLTAALAWVSVLSNPIGIDGADALIEVFEQNTNLRTLLGIEEGITEVNLSKKNVDPGQAKILASEMKAGRAVAAVNSLTVDSTGDMQRRNGGPKTYTLTAGDVSIDLSSKNLGFADIALLTAWLQRPEVNAAVKKINLSGCPLTGAEKIFGKWEKIDSDMTGFIALCGVLGKLHEINMSDCGLGAASAGEFAKAVSDADAALNSLRCGSNPITDKGMIPLLDAVKGIGHTELDISNTEVGPPTAAKLAEVLADGTPFSAAVAVLKISGAFTPFSSSPHSQVDPSYQLTLITGIHAIHKFTPFTS